MKNKLILLIIVFLSCSGNQICAMDHKRSSGDDFDQQNNNKRPRLAPEDLATSTATSPSQTPSSVPQPTTNTENTKKDALSILERIKEKHAKKPTIFLQSMATESKTSSGHKKTNRKPKEKLSAPVIPTKSSFPQTASSSAPKKSAEFAVPHLPTDHPTKVAEKKQLRITKLFDAIRENELSTVKKIVSAGVDIEATTSDGSTPLMLATAKNAREIVEYLVKMNAKIGATNNKGLNSLHLAAKKNNSYILVLLLGGNQAGKPNINSVSMNGLTPLMVAAFFGSDTAFDVLLTYGADVTIQSRYGETVFDIVLRKLEELGQYKTHEDRFITAKRDQYIYIKNKLISYDQGHFTEEQAQEELPSWRSTQGINEFYRLYRNFDSTGQLHRAVNAGDIPEIKRILKENPELINTPNQNGETPLHYAVMNGHVFITKLLLQHGADRNIKNKSNQTPLDVINNRLRFVTRAPSRETLAYRFLEINALLEQDIVFVEPSTKAACMKVGTSSSSSNTAFHQSELQDQATDVWSMGVKMLEAVSSKLPQINSAAAAQMAMQTRAIRASPTTKSVINPLWITFAEDIINECNRILALYKMTATATVLATIRNQLIELYSSLRSFNNSESFVNGIMSILRNNVMSLISNKDSVDFVIELDTALQELINRDDIAAKLQALALLGFNLKAAAEFITLKRNTHDDDQDGAAGSTALPKKFVEKMQQIFSKTEQAESSHCSFPNLKTVSLSFLMNRLLIYRRSIQIPYRQSPAT